MAIVASSSLLDRIRLFIRDFLPAQNLQFLFPLTSLLLLLGASHSWYLLRLPPAVTALLQQPQTDTNAIQHALHSYATWVELPEQIAIGLVYFAFVASLVLWSLSVRNVVRKCIAWVLAPAGIALVALPTFLMATTRERNASLVAAFHIAVPATSVRFVVPSDGIFLTLSGFILYAISISLVHKGRVVLPLRFRGASKSGLEQLPVPSARARNIFAFIIFVIVCTYVVRWISVYPALFEGKLVSWSSRSFFSFQWIPALVEAVAAAIFAFLLMRAEISKMRRRLFGTWSFRYLLLGLAIPLACILASRFLFVVFQPYLEPAQWPKLFFPQPLPAVLIVYVIAFFEEIAIRGYLQAELEKLFSLRQSIFLTGILWSLLLGFGMTLFLPYIRAAELPGIPTLYGFAAFIIYSVPLGWLYARTRSILATTLMHGTIVVFHVGLGNDVHLNHPEFYGAELALWIFFGWFLFWKKPLVNTESARATEPLTS